jgi:hypothetical protein
MGIGRKHSSSTFENRGGPSHSRYREVSSGPSRSSYNGLRRHSQSSDYPDPKLPNPDPNNYKVEEVKTVGRFLIVRIKYPDCTNYEGMKILVYEDVSLEDLINQKLIDPHFCNNKKYKSPVARFVPTPRGQKMAIVFANAMANI